MMLLNYMKPPRAFGVVNGCTLWARSSSPAGGQTDLGTFLSQCITPRMVYLVFRIFLSACEETETGQISVYLLGSLRSRFYESSQAMSTYRSYFD